MIKTKLTVLNVNDNHEGPTHEFFSSIREHIEEDLKPGQEYSLSDGAFTLLHSSCDDYLDESLDECAADYPCYQAMMLFLAALAEHGVVFELHYPDGFKCRLQFV